MKKKVLLTAMIGFFICSANLFAQIAASTKSAGPYTIKNSAIFESPSGYLVLDPINYGKDGFLQMNIKGMESLNLKKFSNDLKQEKENTVDITGKFNERANYWGTFQLHNKTYIFAREVFRENDNEGVAALELDPKALTVVGTGKSLFKSSNKVKVDYFAGQTMPYSMYLCNDESKFLITYSMAPKEKKDKLSKDLLGFQVFDENLNKIWGDEIEMPYTEAKMDNLGYTLGDDGKVYMLAKVYEGESKKDGAKDKTKANYHFEVLIYQKGSTTPKFIEIKLEEGLFNKEAFIFEDATHNIIVTGFYGRPTNARGAVAGFGSQRLDSEPVPVQGAYLVRLDVEKNTFSKVNGGYYEIPKDVITSYSSAREKEKLQKREDKDVNNDIGIDYLKVRSIYEMQNGSIKIVSEQYAVQSNTSGSYTTYNAYALDVYVMSIDTKGKLEWVKKIPKQQYSGNAVAPSLSIKVLGIGDELHIFYRDTPANLNLTEDQAPHMYMGRNGMLRAVTVGPQGEIKAYDLVDIERYDMTFNIRGFVKSNNSLVSTERRKKENMLFSIDVK